ncbi:MAG: hypothetical protein KDA32_06660 [Phycisphaerales bacterium]|nr:hypothetical protein [Phycisphaerales bacterium]
MTTTLRKRFALALAMALALATGCAVRDDPGYNPYAKPQKGPIGPRVQRVMDDAQAALDRLDQRAENALY